MLIEVILWSSLGFIVYSYFGYPIMLMVISLCKRHPIQKGTITPAVSFIITAYNEEQRIKEKIENTLEQEYPAANLEIIVASDCSTDRTDEIVGMYEDRGVKLVRAPERKGKENAQRHAIDTASGEILIFSDVATVLRKDGVSTIIGNFSDETVACVSSTDKIIDKDGKISGEGAYVRYEMFLRDLESKVNTLVGLSGSFFAARKAVCREWEIGLPSDFNVLLNSVKMGLRGISDPDSVGYYSSIVNERDEYGRKVRTVLRGISAFMKNLDLMNPFRYGLFAWQFFSHKLCRWLVPFAMIAAFLSNLILAAVFTVTILLQVTFYLFAIIGIAANSAKSIFKLPAFFVLVNSSILTAWYLYFRGETMVMWTPSDRRAQDDNTTN